MTTSRAGVVFRTTLSVSHPTFVFRMEQVCCRILIECTTSLMVGTEGIAAEKYSHVKHFPNRAAYDDNCDIAVDIGEEASI